MSSNSAGVLLWRARSGTLEVLLAHPGGPYWMNRDDGAWSIPKGEYDPDDEPPLAAALREFSEETGHSPDGEAVDLGTVRQAGGKSVQGFAIEGDLDPDTVEANTFEIEWPPRSGRRETFPEVDEVRWFSVPVARTKINAAQAEFLDRLVTHLAGD